MLQLTPARGLKPNLEAYALSQGIVATHTRKGIETSCKAP